MGFCIRLVRLDFSQCGPSERPERTEMVRRCEREAGAQEGEVRALASSWLLGGHSQAMPIRDLDWRISTNREYAPILRRSGRQRRLLGAYVGQIGSDCTRQFVIVSRLLKISGCACFQRALFVALVR